MVPKLTRQKRADAWAYVHLGLFGAPDGAEAEESEDSSDEREDEIE